MKNFSTRTLLFVFLVFIFSKTQAQNFPYTVITETGTYSNLVNATELSSVGDLWDDPEYLDIPLGFTLDYFGTSTSTVIMDNFFLGGFVSFGELDYDVLSTPIIAVYFDDLIDVENVNAANQSTISHLTEGSSGNQVFKMEWNNCGFYNEFDDLGTTNDIINFQLWIYEATGNIEIRFGPNMITNPSLVHEINGTPIIGLIDEYNADLDSISHFWYLKGDPMDPTLDSISNVTVSGIDPLVGFSSEPVDGMVYRFVNLEASTKTLIQDLNIKVYPTLVENEFFVEMDQEILDKKTQLTVVNNLGQEIFSQNITNTKERLDASNFPKGIYYITITNEEGLGTKKIIKN